VLLLGRDQGGGRGGVKHARDRRTETRSPFSGIVFFRSQAQLLVLLLVLMLLVLVLLFLLLRLLLRLRLLLQLLLRLRLLLQLLLRLRLLLQLLLLACRHLLCESVKDTAKDTCLLYPHRRREGGREGGHGAGGGGGHGLGWGGEGLLASAAFLAPSFGEGGGGGEGGGREGGRGGGKARGGRGGLAFQVESGGGGG